MTRYQSCGNCLQVIEPVEDQIGNYICPNCRRVLPWSCEACVRATENGSPRTVYDPYSTLADICAKCCRNSEWEKR